MSRAVDATSGAKAVVSSADDPRPGKGAGRAIGVSRAVHGLCTGSYDASAAPLAILAALRGDALLPIAVAATSTESVTPRLKAEACPDAKCGYWFYKEPPKRDKPDEDETQSLLPPPPPEEELAKLKPPEFQKLLQDYLNQALTTLEPEHVAWYYEMQDFARRRSRAFMNVTQLVMLNKPELNVNSAYPVSVPGINARVVQKESSVDQRLQGEREGAALVLLSRRTCGLCEAQRSTLKYFQAKHGWHVSEFDLDQRPDIATRFATSFTPTTIVIFRGTQEWMPVAVGVVTVPQIEDGVYGALRMMHGETTPQQYGTQEYEDGGVMDPQRMSQ